MSTSSYAIRDSATMLRRNLLHVRRYPSMTLGVLLVPTFMLLLFRYAFGTTLGAAFGARGSGYINYLTPGILVLAVSSASVSTAVAVNTDMTEGIINRFRTMAIARVSVLTGHVLGSVIQTFGGTVVVARIREVQAQRRRIAQLTAGDRLFVPAEIADVLDRIRSLGISPQEMRIERDGWILLAARYPEQAVEWARVKLASLEDPEFQRIYRAYYESVRLDPSDPRLDELADAIVDFAELHRADVELPEVDLEHVSATPPVDDPVAMALVLSRTAGMPPAWERLDELCRDKARARNLSAAQG